MKNVTVLAVYKVRPGLQSRLLDLLSKHAPVLREQGLLSETPTRLLRAGDSHFIEVVTWKSEEEASRAHAVPAVQEIWGQMAQAAEFVGLADLPEASRPFASFTDISAELL